MSSKLCFAHIVKYSTNIRSTNHNFHITFNFHSRSSSLYQVKHFFYLSFEIRLNRYGGPRFLQVIRIIIFRERFYQIRCLQYSHALSTSLQRWGPKIPTNYLITNVRNHFPWERSRPSIIPSFKTQSFQYHRHTFGILLQLIFVHESSLSTFKLLLLDCMLINGEDHRKYNVW